MNVSAQRVIEIRVAGEHVAPGLIRSRDLAEIIASVEEMIASLVAQNYEGIEKDEIIVGLSAVRGGSVMLDFVSGSPDLVFPAYEQVARSVVEGTYDQLPRGTIEALKSISRFSRKQNCDLEFRSQNGRSELLATITPSTVVDVPEPAKVVGSTTLYGRLMRAGGMSGPKALIELVNGETLICSFSPSLARKLGQYLYSHIALTGTATWLAETLAIESFAILDVHEFEDHPIDEAMAGLAAIVGSVYDEIKDVERYVWDLRSADGEL